MKQAILLAVLISAAAFAKAQSPPTSTGLNVYSYNEDNTIGQLENGQNGIMPTTLAIGITETTSRVPQTN